MKKILALILALTFAFAIVGCGGGSDKDSNVTSSSNQSTNPYVGTWHHERTDDEPVDMLLNLKDDGTGAVGRNNLTPLTWKENDDETITITINFSSGDPKVTTAYFTEKDVLFWDYGFTVKTTSGDMVEIENLKLKKE